MQLYTSFGYDGVGACRRIKDELNVALAREEKTWQEVVDQSVRSLSKTEVGEKAKVLQQGFNGLSDTAEDNATFKTLVDEAMAIKQQL